MKIALFSQSLFALPCLEAIEATSRIGFSAIELACTRPWPGCCTNRSLWCRLSGRRIRESWPPASGPQSCPWTGRKSSGWIWKD